MKESDIVSGMNTPEMREAIEASIFEDMRTMRSQGYSLITLILNDLAAHETICDAVLEEREGKGLPNKP